MKNTTRSFRFRLLAGAFAVVRLEPDSPLPAWATRGDFFSITKTDDELSIVCRKDLLPRDVDSPLSWSCLKLLGPFAFNDVGIVASITSIIAAAGIGVFVVSTFDGDHILVNEQDLRKTIAALQENGHIVR